ncbi:uncharacterized protein LY89DRAFT_685896 [Mollisia scopiformis]|uniref:Zn(2)-C6 fungal-type domain-containing protein n=1 Tax=Mollisia scopiformis TaxID=149040 RepID=A0A194X7H1_MOLSC|nr:uncharacterized protein LY89DRAFT_685896 [Mollisia scopiformis]KUJ16044.1 hypothetical protein LY89DRAFT_685896 [Mollisia scopiformis]
METHSRRRVPLDKRKRTETSCDKCKSRKQKCDRIHGQTQCRYCELHGIECTSTQPRKKRVYGNVEGLGTRLALLESLVKGLLPEANLSSNDEMQQLGKSLGIPLPPLEDNTINAQKNKEEEEITLPLLPDQQGQVQYIGPASSFGFHLKLRRLIGNYTDFQFSMFGKNAADPDITLAFPNASGAAYEKDPGGQRTLSNASSDCGSPSEAMREIDPTTLESLIDSYFDVVHSDFPVLHDASFRETYELWTVSDATSAANPVWLCGLFCVLLLARRVASVSIPQEAERHWWRYVQTLLPTVFFASNIFAVQALLLAALHLHNTSHRDACWNLTGTAVRIAHAIGLHRDDVKHAQSPLGRELRKQLWWTLYAFEQMQVSSYDRPSVIEHNVSLVSCPNERIVGVAGHCPQDYMKWSQKLVILFGTACRVLNTVGNNHNIPDDAYSRPLSPAAGVLRDLIKWQKELPSHLRLDVTDSLAPSSRRPILLLHAQFHYTVLLMSRSTLLRRATVLSTNIDDPPSEALLVISKTCIDSGRALGRLLLKLDSINKFNAFTWWDIFYTVASALILVLDISCSAKQNRLSSGAASKDILQKLACLMSRQLRDWNVPGSMAKWATIVVDVNATAEELMTTPTMQRSARLQDVLAPAAIGSIEPIQHIPQHESDQTIGINDTGLAIPFPYSSPTDGFSYETPAPGREEAQQFWAELSFMDDLNEQSQDWSWDDIDAILRGSEQQNDTRRHIP